MPRRSVVNRNTCMQSRLCLVLAKFTFCSREGILFGVLQMQLIKAIDAARFTDGCDKLPDIHDS